MKELIAVCVVITSACAFGVNTWGGIGTSGVNKWGGIGNTGVNTWGGAGAGLADGMNRRIQIEMQRRQQQLQEQEQRNAEERNRLMREEVRQREIEAQRQREAQEADYRAHMEREAEAAERRAREESAQRQREAAKLEQEYLDSRCAYVENGKHCTVRAVREGYCNAHYQTIIKQREAAERAEKERNEKYDAAMRNLKKCAAKYASGKPCENWANPGTPYCYKHQEYDPAHPIQEKVTTPESQLDEDNTTTRARLQLILNAIRNYENSCGKPPQELKQARLGRYKNRLILVDAWNNEFVYKMRSDAFTVTSMGADGKIDTEDDLVVMDAFSHPRQTQEE